MELINWLLSECKLAIAGLVGALISAPFHTEVKTPVERIIFAGTGVGCAYWLTGLVSAWFDIDPQLTGGVGFLLGAFGGSLIAATVRAIRDADLWAFFKGKFGGDSE